MSLSVGRLTTKAAEHRPSVALAASVKICEENNEKRKQRVKKTHPGFIYSVDIYIVCFIVAACNNFVAL